MKTTLPEVDRIDLDSRPNCEKTSSSGTTAGSRLVFSKDGICRIILDGLPKPVEIEVLIEDYVTQVELLPYLLKVILLDISELVHLQARSRQVFSELLVQASRHYGGRIQVVIAGGPPMIRKYTEIYCRALKFQNRTWSFETLAEALVWLVQSGFKVDE